MSSCIGEGCTHPSCGHKVVPITNPFVNPPKQYRPSAVARPIPIWRCRAWVPFGVFAFVMRRCNREKQSLWRSFVRLAVSYDLDRDLSQRIRLWLGKRKAKSLLVRWWNNDLPEVKENL